VVLEGYVVNVFYETPSIDEEFPLW
jgi:hypothetical protein